MPSSIAGVNKAAPYDVLVDGFESAMGDGPTVKFPKGKCSPKNEYEETLLQTAVEHGIAKAPAASPSEPEEA